MNIPVYSIKTGTELQKDSVSEVAALKSQWPKSVGTKAAKCFTT